MLTVIEKLARSSHAPPRLFPLLVEQGYVDVAQQIWKDGLTEDLLENNEELPPLIRKWMTVILFNTVTSMFCHLNVI